MIVMPWVVQMISSEFKEWFIDRVVPFHMLLCSDACIHEHNRQFPTDTGTCFCPFHDNYNTKSAKLYSDAGGQRIYCFAENRMYRPHDLITRGIVEIDIDKFFDRLWAQIDEATKAVLVAQSALNVGGIPDLKDYSSLYDAYRRGELPLSAVALGMLES